MPSDIAGTDAVAVLAGDCTVRFETSARDGQDETAGSVREDRGDVVLLEKPDGTVLVHDREGYRPLAWLTGRRRLLVAGGTDRARRG